MSAVLPNLYLGSRSRMKILAPAADMDRRARVNALLPLRVKLLVHLAAAGCDFIHCDADAFWLGDPRPGLTELPAPARSATRRPESSDEPR